MRFRTTMIIGALAIAVGILVIISEINENNNGGQGKWINRLFDVKTENIVKFTLERPSGQLVAEKVETDWQISAPYVGTADGTEIRNIVNRFELATVQARLSRNDISSLADYGLDSPQAAGTAYTKDKSFTICLGKPTVAGDGVYAMTPAYPDYVFVIAKDVIEAFNTPASEFKDKFPFKYDPKLITEVDISFLENQVVLKKTDARWDILRPIADLADTTQVENIVDTGIDIKALEFFDSTLPMSTYGLDNPTKSIVLKNDKASFELKAGKTYDDGKMTYAMAGGFKDVLGVDTERLESMFIPLQQLRDRGIFTLDPVTITGIKLYSKGAMEFELARRKGRNEHEFFFVKPEGYGAEFGATYEFLEELKALKADDFFAVASFPESEIRLEFTTAKGTFSYALTEFNGKTAIVDSIRLRGTVCDISLLMQLRKGVYRFKSKSVYSYPKETEILGIKLSRQDGTFEIVNDKGTWRPASDPAGTVNPFDVQYFLISFGNLLVTDEYVLPGNRPISDFGFSAPAYTVVFKAKVGGKDEEYGFAVGNRANPDQYYALSLRTNELFLLPAFKIEDIARTSFAPVK